MTHIEPMKTLAREAGDIMQKHFDNVQKQIKNDGSEVTIADKEINEVVEKWVSKNFPEHNFYGEEGNNMEKESHYLWVCDPIDGTRMFLQTVPTSVFSLALVKDGEPIAAVVYDPWTDKLYSAEKGKGAYVNDQKIFVSDQDRIEESEIGYTIFSKAKYDFIPFFTKICSAGANHTNTGSAVNMGCLVALGKIDGVIFPHTTFHDAAAIALIIEEAGGIITDLFGKKQRYDKPIEGFIAGNKAVHKQLVEIFRKLK